MKGENKEKSFKEGRSKAPEGRVAKRKTKVILRRIRKAAVVEGGLKEGCGRREGEDIDGFSVALFSPMSNVVGGGGLSGLTASPAIFKPLLYGGRSIARGAQMIVAQQGVCYPPRF